MANISNSYDPDAEAQGDFSPIPAGEYRAKIIDSEIEPVSKSSEKGRCLRLTWQVETGPYDGRLVWQRLNMWAENMNNIDKVISIAQSQFASIRQATGKSTPQDSVELHNIPCTIRVSVKTDESGQYPPQNEVKGVKAIGSAPAAANGGNSAPGKPSGSAPWRKPAA